MSQLFISGQQNILSYNPAVDKAAGAAGEDKNDNSGESAVLLDTVTISEDAKKLMAESEMDQDKYSQEETSDGSLFEANDADESSEVSGASLLKRSDAEVDDALSAATEEADEAAAVLVAGTDAEAEETTEIPDDSELESGAEKPSNTTDAVAKSNDSSIINGGAGMGGITESTEDLSKQQLEKLYKKLEDAQEKLQDAQAKLSKAISSLNKSGDMSESKALELQAKVEAAQAEVSSAQGEVQQINEEIQEVLKKSSG